MNVERDIVGFALPFATGAFIAAYAGHLLHTESLSHITVALTVTLGLTAVLLHPVHRKFAPAYIWLIIGCLGISLGMFTYFHGSVAAVSSMPWRVAAAEEFGEALRGAVDRIPFCDTQTNALIKALITGAREDLSPETTQGFRNSGASHILALSGLHLGIIYGLIRYSLSAIGNSRTAIYTKAFITIAACGFYTLATGAGPSIVRAFLFILLNETARATHRHHTTASVLFAALIIQVVLSPASVRSVGFQLSYTAMAGIAFIYPWLRDFWPSEEGDPTSLRSRINIMRRVWEAASLSIACQITTGPLAYLYFRSLPGNFLLTNLLALPLTTALIPAALVTTALHSAGICPDAAIRVTEWLAQTLLRSLEIIAAM